MRKQLLFLLTMLLLSPLLFAQATKWKAFEDFHKTVGQVLHPVMAGHIQPVKDSSGILLRKAKAWQASDVPKSVDASVFHQQIGQLVTECKTLDDAVKAMQNDAVLKTDAMKVHDTFHALLDACHIKE